MKLIDWLAASDRAALAEFPAAVEGMEGGAALGPLGRTLATLHGLMLAAAGAVEVGHLVGLVETVVTALAAGAAGVLVAVGLLVAFARRGRRRVAAVRVRGTATSGRRPRLGGLDDADDVRDGV